MDFVNYERSQFICGSRKVFALLFSSFTELLAFNYNRSFVRSHTLDVDPEANDQHYHQLASNVLAEFVYEIERSATQFHDNLAMKASFTETANNLRQQFGPNPSALLKHLTRCLKYEISLIEILSKLMGLSAAVKINHTSVQELKNDYEQINQQKEELKQMAYVTNDPQEEALMDALLSDERERFNQNLVIVQNKKFQLINDINAVIEQMIHAYDLIVVQQLRQWKIDQRLAGNGAVFHNNLDTIQQWFEKLAENLRHTKTHIQMLYWGRQTIVLPLEASGHPDQLQPLEQRIDHLLVMLVTASFVIENQPPQVLKTNTKISPSVPVRVRVLTGRQLDIILDRKVHVSIVAGEKLHLLLVDLVLKHFNFAPKKYRSGSTTDTGDEQRGR